MKYYIRMYHDGHQDVAGGVWKLEAERAVRIDVIESGLNIFKAAPGLDVISTLKKQFPDSGFYELRLRPGEFYPRMARPNSSNPTESLGTNPDDGDELRYTRVKSTGQLHALIEQLEHVCRVVHPENNNLDAFGHEIRNILILACTEVEMHWKNILDANGTNGSSATEYVKLADAMKLPNYTVKFNYYPWLGSMKPFERWRSGSRSPSKDLNWYFAYNQVKHNRDTYFSEATLRRAFQAVAGCFVMLCAQYGWDFAIRGIGADRAFLRLMKAPAWDPSEVYVPPYGGTLKSKNYPF